FRTAPWTFDLQRLLAAAYLAWLGQQKQPGGGLALPTSDAGSAPVVPHADRRALLPGLLTNLLNPKALLFCSVLQPQFV
ncbi:LysE family transporter, partial [Pseudomonas aeruginosa]|uniref:LysE family transporter n=1 Tax=Pseudomonas aeruginosa TaxID=287 RepID=UPI003CC5E8D5